MKNSKYLKSGESRHTTDDKVEGLVGAPQQKTSVFPSIFLQRVLRLLSISRGMEVPANDREVYFFSEEEKKQMFQIILGQLQKSKLNEGSGDWYPSCVSGGIS